MKVRDMCEMVVDQFDLDEHVSDRLEFHYEHWTGPMINRKKNIKKLYDSALLLGYKAREESGKEFHVTLNDLHLGVRYQAGDEVMEDVSCDSDCMLMIMPSVGQAIWDAYFWIPLEHYIY